MASLKRNMEGFDPIGTGRRRIVEGLGSYNRTNKLMLPLNFFEPPSATAELSGPPEIYI